MFHTGLKKLKKFHGNYKSIGTFLNFIKDIDKFFLKMELFSGSGTLCNIMAYNLYLEQILIV